MNRRMLFGVGLFALSAALATLSLTRGQEPVPSQNSSSFPTGKKTTAVRNLSKLAPLQQQMYLSAQRGADWLFRANRPDGHFEYGFLPSLKAPLEGDHYLRQVGAAFALARASRLTGDERHAAVARQAILTLLLDTTPETVDGKIVIQHTRLPSMMVNRLAAAGLLVLAINELPNPADDLLKQSDQLCAYIARQQQADGSLSFSDDPTDAKEAASDPEGINYYPGEALYGLMRSQQHGPAAWKSNVVRKALAYYRPWWQKHKNMAFVPWQTAAYAELFLQSQGRDKECADFVFEMSDWICSLQFTALDPKHPLWTGGFMAYTDGKPTAAEPQVGSAAYAEGLVEACRVVRQTGDLARNQRYRESLDRCLQFLTMLQYTEANTQHFADWYRPRLLGGFHASHQDGTLRIDYAQHAVCTLVQYLMYVTDKD